MRIPPHCCRNFNDPILIIVLSEMKIIAAILLVLSARCAHMRVAAVNLGAPVSGLEGVMSGIGNGVSHTVHKVIPDCVFGVQSVSMALFTSDIPKGKYIAENETCNDIDHSKPIIFLVHGFISSANTTESYNLASALVKKGYNVFSLDWSEAACTNGLPIVKFKGYPFAVHNTREIGHLMAEYVKSLCEDCDIPLENITFIGHSLGAHVSGFASKNLIKTGYGKIQRLIAADPAQPLFLTNSCENRVCESDAENVIVLHTSSLGFPCPIGHTDLYFDNGYEQPGCSIDIACSHTRPMIYLTDVVEHSNCKFVGAPLRIICFFPDIEKLIRRKPDYPCSNSNDCVVLDDRIFYTNYLKEGSYYAFVKDNKPETECSFGTSKNFDCQ